MLESSRWQSARSTSKEEAVSHASSRLIPFRSHRNRSRIASELMASAGHRPIPLPPPGTRVQGVVRCPRGAVASRSIAGGCSLQGLAHATGRGACGRRSWRRVPAPCGLRLRGVPWRLALGSALKLSVALLCTAGTATEYCSSYYSRQIRPLGLGAWAASTYILYGRDTLTCVLPREKMYPALLKSEITSHTRHDSPESRSHRPRHQRALRGHDRARARRNLRRSQWRAGLRIAIRDGRC